MRGAADSFWRALRQIADVIVLPDLLQRPAHAQVAHQAPGEPGHPIEGGDDGLCSSAASRRAACRSGRPCSASRARARKRAAPAARDIGLEVRVVGEDRRVADMAQHLHHQQVAGAECAVEPVVVAQRRDSSSSRSRSRFIRSAAASLAQLSLPSMILRDHLSQTTGSTVLSAANIHSIARARPAGSSGNRPGQLSAIWSTIAPDSNRTSPSSS